MRTTWGPRCSSRQLLAAATDVGAWSVALVTCIDGAPGAELNAPRATEDMAAQKAVVSNKGPKSGPSRLRSRRCMRGPAERSGPAPDLVQPRQGQQGRHQPHEDPVHDRLAEP